MHYFVLNNVFVVYETTIYGISVQGIRSSLQNVFINVKLRLFFQLSTIKFDFGEKFDD